MMVAISLEDMSISRRRACVILVVGNVMGVGLLVGVLYLMKET
jgi:hypothetical protein